MEKRIHDRIEEGVRSILLFHFFFGRLFFFYGAAVTIDLIRAPDLHQYGGRWFVSDVPALIAPIVVRVSCLL